MLSEPTANRPSLLPFALGFLSGAAVIAVTVWLARPGDPTPVRRVVRDVEVQYLYETGPGQASGSTLRASSIEFYPGYVVVTNESGLSGLYAASRLRGFTFTTLPDDSADKRP